MSFYRGGGIIWGAVHAFQVIFSQNEYFLKGFGRQNRQNFLRSDGFGDWETRNPQVLSKPNSKNKKQESRYLIEGSHPDTLFSNRAEMGCVMTLKTSSVWSTLTVVTASLDIFL